MEKLFIRNETESDYEVVEDITRNAFWNVYVPGCYEHYLVHVMRKHVDFIPMLDFVAELDGQIIGNIMYTKSAIRKELKQKVLDGRKWYYHESPVYNIDIDEAEKFDRKFKEKEKEYKKSQEEFYIYSRSVILGE